jgi:hypothetical protein
MGITTRRRQMGQSIVELAVATPVLLLLILGGVDVGVMVSDKVIAGAACRQGARLAAEIGGKRTNPNPLTTTDTIDLDIVKNVVAVAQAMNYSALTYIYIYQPINLDGDFHNAGELYDKWDVSGAPFKVSGNFDYAVRYQVPPTETPIGVRIEWNYKPPTGIGSFAIGLSEHTVFLAAPVIP